uniref:Uncharacterized protein n=1 Tax=Timema poppense TaxID=170557 RepID=A0A7R9H1L4_TIMPO|nr:unnamed protein product [Timema poppensis]
MQVCIVIQYRHVVDYVNNEVLRLTSRIGDIEIQSLQVQVIRVSAFTRSVARKYVTGVFRSFIIQPHFQRDFPEVYIIISKEEVYLHFRGGRVKYHLGKTTFNTPEPDQDSNINLPVIGSLVYCESSSLDHVATETVSYCPSHTRVNSLFLVRVDEIKVVETPPEPVRSKLELLIEEVLRVPNLSDNKYGSSVAAAKAIPQHLFAVIEEIPKSIRLASSASFMVHLAGDLMTSLRDQSHSTAHSRINFVV